MSERGRDLRTAAIGAGVLAVGGLLARAPLHSAEIRGFRTANQLPDRLFRPVWMGMQYGTFGTVPALAAVMALRRRPRTATAVALGGTAAWLLAKLVKPWVGRARPGAILPRVNHRGQEEGDLGFPSGHAAVSAALSAALWPTASPAVRAVCGGLSAIVAFARVYVGAHLPLDVLGGAGLGVAVGSAAKMAVRQRSGQSESP